MVSSVEASSGGAVQTGTGVAAGGRVIGKDDFLKLLVAQIRNQNPLNPADGVEFLTQLAQFSQLEQLINIRTRLEELTAGGRQQDQAAA
ncbi:MAG: hypothetical protein IT159_13125 [Bryobacterales bacterium]|jgi:flagellar basal-body rod modification protein FlgD|nr:hypothetical protein [Bryobacterales bacterium]